MLQILQPRVVLSRLELLTPTLSVWCSNQLSYRTVMELCMARNTLDLLFQVLHLLYGYRQSVDKEQSKSTRGHRTSEKKKFSSLSFPFRISNNINTLLFIFKALQKGGVPLSYLTFAEAKVELRQGTSPFLPERRCSSRTFRYGYLVTT